MTITTDIQAYEALAKVKATQAEILNQKGQAQINPRRLR